VGDHVVLAPDYQQCHDAVKGPLKPGDAGVMIACDIHNGVIRALVAVSESKWYYDKRALRRAPINSGPTPSTVGIQGAAGHDANAAPANVHLDPAAPTHAAAAATATAGTPASASSGGGGFTFSFGPAAGSVVRLYFCRSYFSFNINSWLSCLL